MTNIHQYPAFENSDLSLSALKTLISSATKAPYAFTCSTFLPRKNDLSCIEVSHGEPRNNDHPFDESMTGAMTATTWHREGDVHKVLQGHGKSLRISQ